MIKLLEHRTKTGLTQTQLALRSGLSQGLISQIEAGEIKNPGYQTLQKLALGLNISIGELYESTPTDKLTAESSSGQIRETA